MEKCSTIFTRYNQHMFLPSSATPQQLASALSVFGEVHLKIVGSKALATFTKVDIPGLPRILPYDEATLQLNVISKVDQRANLFIKHLPPGGSDQKLEAIMSQFGLVYSCKIARNKSGAMLNYGYVQFVELSSALAAKKFFHGKAIMGKRIEMYKFVPKEMRSTLLLVLNSLGGKVSKQELEQVFTKYGDTTVTMNEDFTSAEIQFRNNGTTLAAWRDLDSREDVTFMYTAGIRNKSKPQTKATRVIPVFDQEKFEAIADGNKQKMFVSFCIYNVIKEWMNQKAADLITSVIFAKGLERMLQLLHSAEEFEKCINEVVEKLKSSGKYEQRIIEKLQYSNV